MMFSFAFSWVNSPAFALNLPGLNQLAVIKGDISILNNIKDTQNSNAIYSILRNPGGSITFTTLDGKYIYSQSYIRDAKEEKDLIDSINKSLPQPALEYVENILTPDYGG